MLMRGAGVRCTRRRQLLRALSWESGRLQQGGLSFLIE